HPCSTFTVLYPYTTLFRSPPEHRGLPRREAERQTLADAHPRRSASGGRGAGGDRKIAGDAAPRIGVHRTSRDGAGGGGRAAARQDRKSTRLNSSHVKISYA